MDNEEVMKFADRFDCQGLQMVSFEDQKYAGWLIRSLVKKNQELETKLQNCQEKEKQRIIDILMQLHNERKHNNNYFLFAVNQVRKC